MRSVLVDVELASRRPRIIHTSIGQGYSWADVATWVQLSTHAPMPIRPRHATPREALERALQASGHPILLLDVGESTFILAEAQ